MVIVGSHEQAVIVLGSAATWLERHAADELRRYLAAVTGTDLSIISETDLLAGLQSVIVVGQPHTCDLLETLAREGHVSIQPDTAGGDGFVIKTATRGGCSYLVLGAPTARGVLYAVYHFLEYVVHCGFFEDGERLPHAAEVLVADLDMTEAPFFPYRSYLSPCAQSYTTQYWSLAEWKDEIDWLAKKKVNLLYFWPAWVRGNRLDGSRPPLALRRTWRKLGLSCAGDTAEDDDTRLALQIIAYARQRGMRIVSAPGFQGAVPAEFREHYPESTYLEVTWGQTSPEVHLDPADPMFARVLEINLREHIELYGADHRYDYGMYAETAPGGSPEEGMRLRQDYAAAVSRAIRAVDPEGIWQLQSWCFLGPPELTPHEVESILARVPDDAVYICDTWAESKPQYQRHHHFYGKPWEFAVLHVLGGNATLHGDVRALYCHVKELVNDPRASKCRYFGVVSEIIKHNTFYYDLVMRLGWQPKSVDLATFVHDYAVRRYGDAAAPGMAAFLARLLESVYATDDWTPPQYQIWSAPGAGPHLATRFHLIDKLRAALRVALNVTELHTSRLYINDITDVCRQFLGELFNYHWVKLEEAFFRGEQDAFAHQAEVLCSLLSRQADLLELHPEHRLSTEIDRAIAAGLEPSVAEMSVKARFTYLGLLCGCSWGDRHLFLLDYARSDKAELIRHYYLPRVRIYVEELSKHIDWWRGMPAVPGYPPSEDLEKRYNALARQFVETPLPHTDAPSQEELDSIPGRIAAILEQCNS